jgi:hypothetical protein
MYYLTKLEGVVKVEGFDDLTINVQQLVKASSKEKAREAVKKAAIEDQGKKLLILAIYVFDTLIGE